MTKTYLDASTIIYLVEAASPFHAVAAGWVDRLLCDPSAALVTSRLSLLECRVRPLGDHDSVTLTAYDRFFSARRMITWDVTADVIERATLLRARYGFRTPDAIHLATALVCSADSFLTGDAALERCRDIRVTVLRAGE